MGDDLFVFTGNQISSQSETNDSTDSLDGSESDDVLATLTGNEFDDLFNTCSLLDLESEPFDSADWLFSRSERKCSAADREVKPRINNSTVCNGSRSIKKDPGYLTERLHWNYRQKRVNYDPRPISKRSRKRCIPEEKKDDAYWKKRCQNTERARKSREARRLKEIEVLQKVKTLEQEKSELQQEVLRLKEQLIVLSERLLKQEEEVSLFD